MLDEAEVSALPGVGEFGVVPEIFTEIDCLGGSLVNWGQLSLRFYFAKEKGFTSLTLDALGFQLGLDELTGDEFLLLFFFL